MRVENFRNYWLYKQSLTLMQAIYQLTDHITLNHNEEHAIDLYRLATKIPKLIASGIGQTNIKIRIKRFNEVKGNLEDVREVISTYQERYQLDSVYLDEIEDNIIKILKLVNGYFGSLSKKLVNKSV